MYASMHAAGVARPAVHAAGVARPAMHAASVHAAGVHAAPMHSAAAPMHPATAPTATAPTATANLRKQPVIHLRRGARSRVNLDCVRFGRNQASKRQRKQSVLEMNSTNA